MIGPVGNGGTRTRQQIIRCIDTIEEKLRENIENDGDYKSFIALQLKLYELRLELRGELLPNE